MIYRRKTMKSIASAILLCFTSLTGAQPLYAIPANTQLPAGPDGTTGKPEIMVGTVHDNVSGNTLTLTQDGKTSVLKWGDFSIGADAAVEFKSTENGFNSLNYVANGGPVSEIYGQLTALGGNIFIANPAGVQIGNSAQINVGSLYVTNKDIGDALSGIDQNSKTSDIASAIKGLSVADTNAELMSLGAIVNAKSVTFDGGRIVLDTERIYAEQDGEMQKVENPSKILNIRTTDTNNVVLGYDAYQEDKGYSNAETKQFSVTNKDDDTKTVDGYMWVHDLDELRAMSTNTHSNYALRNSIDANATAEATKRFKPIGRFSGNFDGLGYSIFGLHIDTTNSPDDYAGLFSSTDNANIRNFTLNGGSINGTNNVGAAVGSASGGTIENITSTATVSGQGNVGGIVGSAQKVEMSGLINIGAVNGKVDSSNIGGVVGQMSDGSLSGQTYNLGHVSGGHNVGGIVGNATDNAAIGNAITEDTDTFQIYNQLNVTGGYNVGGIVGSISGGSVTNAANYGDVTANGSTTETYTYHTVKQSGETETTTTDRLNVKVANAGGIAGISESGSAITDVVNTGDVTSVREGDDNHYKAGNVGGIVGRAVDTTITNAENKENTVAGAHNVGGIAGFLGGTSKIDTGVNNGGDITGTGGRTDSDYPDTYYYYDDTWMVWQQKTETYTDDYVRERVRPYGQWGENEIFIVGNIGGIAGYIYGGDAQIINSGNRGTVHSELIDPGTPADQVLDSAKAANVGGVVGKISQSDNDAINTIESTPENATIYNSYNTGGVQGYTGVGGVIGSMYNGSIAGSYNLGTLRSTRQASSGSLDPLNMGGVVGDTTEDTGAKAVIYNVYNAGTIGDAGYEYYGRHVGGIVGRLSGTLEKSYNTGDVYNGYSTVGGVAGWWYSGDITNVFNTGNVTVRIDSTEDNARTGGSQVGGIIGASSGNGGGKYLTNAYNLGTIRSFAVTNPGYGTTLNSIGGIIGNVQGTSVTSIKNVYTTNNLYAAKATEGTEPDGFIKSTDGLGAIYGRGTPSTIENAYYVKMYGDGVFATPHTNGVTDILEPSSVKPLTAASFNGFTFFNQSGADIDTTSTNFEDSWRFYDGTTPILNAFLPNAEGYFSTLTDEQLSELGIVDGGIQYGTAANPLLTIIDAKDSSNVTLDWEHLTSSGNASFAVYGGGLTLNNFGTDVGYYRGTLYADGGLAINGAVGEAFQLGSSAKLYGTTVEIDANGDAVIYGNVTSTNGGLFINGDDIEIIGKLESSVQDGVKSVKNIAKKMADDLTGIFTDLSNPKEAISTVSDAFAHTTDEAKNDGAITVTASGNADILYGNLATGSVVSGSAFSVTSKNGNVYVDSDLGGVKGGISLTAYGEALFDISNIAAAGEAQDDPYGAETLIEFLNRHAHDSGNGITLTSTNDNVILAVDMWEEDSFNLDKFNITDTTFSDAIKGLGDDLAGKTHIWISDADQLKGIQLYKDAHQESDILGYNFALKGNIDATELTDYQAIGGEGGYSGTFDGRDCRIIGLNSDAQDNNIASEGIFSKLSGTVKDLRVYASKFFGNEEGNVGAIAAVTDGKAKITGVTTFGNHVEAGADGNAGGIAGTNAGTITNSAASDSVIANNGAAGGVAGINTGTIGEAQSGEEDSFITSESAVTSATNAGTTNTALGGIVGVNEKSGNVYLANSLGVTNGGTAVDNVGGIAGQNHGTMSSLYNESIVSGLGNIGGVAGTNDGELNNAVNTTAITAAGSNAGGIAGTNSGKIDSGRNSGAINGNQNVGGMVGKNTKDNNIANSGILKNLSNALVAAITGSDYVGGVAGSNAGMITSDNNLVNEGTVYGNQYVGGIAGVNELGGVIQNVTSETLVLKTGGTDAQYFGGIAGTNSGTITNATNDSNVKAEGATYVGGIAGHNTNTGWLTGSLVNNGDVTGLSNVGGLAGENNNSSLLKGSADTPLRVTNNGTITATGGGAGGIFHTNTGDIGHAVLTNNGTIIAEGGNANTGGLFGKNSGEITNSTLTNSGEVTGGDNTGGLIGHNTGNITYSSLINGIGAKVNGTKNVGGLIGKNTGNITGGRKDADGNDLGLYTYKIYNNGSVEGVSNVGGLIGHNAADTTNNKTGTLTAAYNTGVVIGTGADGNIGGIVGNNEGTVSTVFNTIMTAIENGETQYGAVSGATNVGGLIGLNAAGGRLMNAYNDTSTVTTTDTDGKAGNAVGSNSGTIKNVYATNKTGKLIGENNASEGNVTNVYTFAADDDSETKIEDDKQKLSASYDGFDFSATGDVEAVWKNYDGWSTPMLKVFLTEATYDSSQENFIYNAGEQKASFEYVTMADDTAYNNVNSLLSPTTGNKNAGTYMAFYSGQIAGSVETTTDDDDNETVTFNPNNLGYDIDASYKINKAQLDVALDEIYRTYGNDTMYGDAAQNNKLPDYSNSFSYTAAAGTTLNETMKNELIGNINITQITDEAVDGLEEGRTTNNVGDHDWSATVGLVGEDILNNYQLNADGASTISVTGERKSHVSKADLTITLSDVQREYGNACTLTGGTDYRVVDSEGLTNGDEKSVLQLIADAFTKGLLIDGGLTEDGRTQNVKGENGTQAQYTWRPTELSVFEGVDNLAQNYNVTYDGGFSTITPRKLTVTNLLVVTDYGNGEFTLEGTPTLSGIADNDGVELVTENAYTSYIAGSAYDQNKNNRLTADVIRDVNAADGLGVYSESLSVTGLTLKNNDFGNYVLADESIGGIKVKPVDLTITLSDVFRIYGDTKFENGTNYGLADGSVKLGANGDRVEFNSEGVTFDDGGLTEDRSKTQKANVSGQTAGYLGDERYSWNVAESDYGKVFGINPDNYNLTVNSGESKVAQRELSVSDLLASIVYGDKDGNGLQLEAGATLSGLADGYDDNVDLVTDGVTLTATGAYEENRNKDGKNRATADVNVTDVNGVYQDSLVASGLKLGGDSVNNYYIANGTATGGIKVTPAPLTITLKDVEHNYGTVLDADAIGYGIKSTEGLVNGDDGAQLTFNAETAKDKDKAIYYHEDGGEWRTNDANGDYSYLGDIEDAFKAGVSRANYYANNGGAVNLDNYDVEYKGGKSVVKPKELGISDILATIIYGNQGGAGFKVSEGGNLTGIVYDDDVSLSQELKIEDAKFATDGSYEINRNGRTTADAGDNYAQKLTFSNLPLYGRHAGNYTVNGNVDAAIAVTRAQLSVTAHDKLTQLGREPEYTGTTYDELNGSLVNGDDLSGFMHAFGIEEAEMLNNAGHYPGKIGVVVDGLYYYYDGTHDWSGHHGLFASYDVNVAAGSLRVFVPVPDSSFNYGWLYDDAPYSRKWNFRERKAEIYFQDGGMEYDKNM